MEGERTIRVGICDDSRPMRVALRALIDDAPGMAPAGTAADGLEAVALVTQYQPDVLVLDLDMPRYDGVYAIRSIRATQPDLPIVVYSGSAGGHLHDAAIEAGATSFVQKGATAAALVDEIALVCNGGAPQAA